MQLGPHAISLGEADDPSSPKAWQGPLRTGACTFDIGIIETPFTLSGKRYLYVPTYSGAARHVALLDLESCTTRWTSAVFAGELHLEQNRLRLGDKSVELDAHCLPAKRIGKPNQSDQ